MTCTASFRSCPAQKEASPAAVMTTTHTSAPFFGVVERLADAERDSCADRVAGLRPVDGPQQHVPALPGEDGAVTATSTGTDVAASVMACSSCR